MIPDGATFETKPAGGVAVYDVTDVLPQHSRKRWRPRNPKRIREMVVHSSGADNADVDGFEAMEDSAHYVVGVRDWPGFAYTYWLSRKADRDSRGRITIYRGNPDSARSWHTKTRNGVAIALCLEGNTTEQELTGDQVEALEAMIPHLTVRHRRIVLPQGLRKHSDFTKPACPGRNAENWLQEYKRSI